ncbi:MAG: NAD(P)-binding domain-containing protein, partial [Limnobacter sp.]
MQNTLFIGGGNMAFAILGGLIGSGIPASTFHVIDPSPDAAAKMSTLNIQCTTDWPSNFTPEIVVLAVKPQLMQTVLKSQVSQLSNKLIISIAAGVSVAQIQHWSQQNNARVVLINTLEIISES